MVLHAGSNISIQGYSARIRFFLPFSIIEYQVSLPSQTNIFHLAFTVLWHSVALKRKCKARQAGQILLWN